MKELKLSIPATSANIGPGFDSFGMALNLYNSFEFSISTEYQLEISGFGAQGLTNINDNLVIDSCKKTCQRLNIKEIPFKLINHNTIPLQSGLGSSATAIIAGVAWALFTQYGFVDKQKLFEESFVMEGHPDNIGAAIFGGFMVGCATPFDKTLLPFCYKIDILKPLKCLVIYPNIKVSTNESRAALPNHFSRSDTVFNISHAAMVAMCFTRGDYQMLNNVLYDKVHEPYRGDVVKYPQFKNVLLKAGAFGVCISGSGPTIICFHNQPKDFFKHHAEEHFLRLNQQVSLFDLQVDNKGVNINFK